MLYFIKKSYYKITNFNSTYLLIKRLQKVTKCFFNIKSRVFLDKQLQLYVFLEFAKNNLSKEIKRFITVCL